MEHSLLSVDNLTLSKDCVHELALDICLLVLAQISGRNNSSLSAPIPKKQLSSYSNSQFKQ